MFGKFFVFIILSFTLFSQAKSYKFEVSRRLESTDAVEPELWSWVEVKAEGDPGGKVNLRVDVPKVVASGFPEVIIFFANDNKNVLKIDLKRITTGTLYTTPYKVEKKMEGEETSVEDSKDFVRLSGSFPANWLPKNCNKISATVTGDDGTYYNYYGIQNLKISIPDLMVVEEYANFDCTSFTA